MEPKVYSKHISSETAFSQNLTKILQIKLNLSYLHCPFLEENVPAHYLEAFQSVFEKKDFDNCRNTASGTT
jgi:hypothetical protein